MSQKLYSSSEFTNFGRKGKLALGRYPYTYARVSFMRSFLLKKDDYAKLMKMNVNEIISYLGGSQYRKEIDELAIRFQGVQLMELALNRNLANTWAKLKQISKPSFRILVSAYLLRADIWNIKAIIRAKYTNLGQEQLKAMLSPVGFLDAKMLEELVKKESVDGILKGVGIIDYGYFANALESFRNSKSLSEIENALDMFYYSAMDGFCRRLRGKGRHFREFLENELETTAILNILRLKRANTPGKDIAHFIVMPASSKDLFRMMIDAPTAADAAKLLEESRFKPLVEKGIREFAASGSLVTLELDLSKSMLQHSVLMIHQHPLSVDFLLGFMFAKELEVRNLRLILKARQLGIGEDFVSQQVITL